MLPFQGKDTNHLHNESPTKLWEAKPEIWDGDKTTTKKKQNQTKQNSSKKKNKNFNQQQQLKKKNKGKSPVLAN